MAERHRRQSRSATSGQWAASALDHARSRMGRPLGIMFGVVILSAPAPANAYCRTAACGEQFGAVCTPSQPSDCGIPVFWPTRCVGFSIHEGGSEDVDLEELIKLTEQSFAAWSEATCEDGAHPSIAGAYLGTVACDLGGYDPEGANANLIVFREDSWPYANSAALALTTVTYVIDTGEIRDADLELNGTQTFSTSDTLVEVDLQSIVTHEVGHFLGIAHSADSASTMRPVYPPKSTELRDLGVDDVLAICDAYPPDRVAECSPSPRNGLQTTCLPPADLRGDGFCTWSSAPPRPSWPTFVFGALVSTLTITRRRARRALF